MRYSIVDVQTSRHFISGDDYDGMCQVFFRIEEQEYLGDAEYLALVDNNTGRAMSVICAYEDD